MQQIKQPILQEFEAFRCMYDASLRSSTPLLNQVVEYIKMRNGKYMRPILTLLMAKMCGEISDSVYHAATSLELLHTASLVHDDVVDGSDKRRGQPSVNALFDNKVAVLVGDYLLATSLKEAAATGNLSIVESVARLGQLLSEGEIMQLNATDTDDFSEEMYYDVIRKKTAALFAACAFAGVVSSGKCGEMAENAYLFGEMIGIAFQIKDDILDYSSADIGKPSGHDMRDGKLTLPALYVLNHYADDEMHELALRIRSLEATSDEIAHFIEFVITNGGIQYAEKCMEYYRQKALDLLPDNISEEIFNALVSYIDFVIARKK